MAAMLDSRDEGDVIDGDDVKTLTLSAARQLVAHICSHLSKSHLTRVSCDLISRLQITSNASVVDADGKLFLSVTGRPFVKRFALCCQTIVCPVCL